MLSVVVRATGATALVCLGLPAAQGTVAKHGPALNSQDDVLYTIFYAILGGRDAWPIKMDETRTLGELKRKINGAQGPTRNLTPRNIPS